MADLDGASQPILLWGTTGVMTEAVLARLLAAGVAVAGLVIPGDDTPAPRRLPPPPPAHDELPLLDAFMQRSAVHLAWAQGLPVYTVGRLNRPGVAVWLAEQAPDAVLVACFPRRIPAALPAIPAHGFLNLHPSRLPAYRGPAPLFWQMRHDVQPLSITLHWMDADLDTGDLAAQADLLRPDGATGPELDARLGALGGDLAAQALAAGLPTRTPQPPGGSYQPWPNDADFSLDLAWNARRAYNFVRATAEWGRPYWVTAQGQTWRVERVLGWDAESTLPAPVVEQGGILRIQFSPGSVFAIGTASAPLAAP
ncbi:MAG: formyl transferase [Caldilineaceae bacterium]|nr:formyl transferase [Caldilineaceae bacterium]